MINRKHLVNKHNPQTTGFDPMSSFSVGNGDYAFTADATGLQTYPELYEQDGVPLGHMANWGWHSFPNPNNYDMKNFAKTAYPTFNGRMVEYPYLPADQVTDEYRYHRFNPHKLHLGQVGFQLLGADGQPAAAGELTEMGQTLDLYAGLLTSRFALDGLETTTQTCCHPQLDLVAVRVRSELIRDGRLQIVFRFPYGDWTKTGGVWSAPEKHETALMEMGSGFAVLERRLDADGYAMRAEWAGGSFRTDEEEPHRFVLTPDADSDVFELCFRFVALAAEAGRALPDVEQTQQESSAHWARFWERSAAVSFEGSTDPRAEELERRVVLSRYLTAIQSCGTLPPQESGLTHNSWAGKFHLEMHWWHAAHFALWDRPDLLENTFECYHGLIGIARETAAEQGYEGARWPKCIGPDGINSPCYIEPFLIWQQPHPIYYAEMLYRIRQDQATLDTYADIVFETAAFMASFAEWDEEGGRYVLGPPVAPAQEIYDHGATLNPTFELAYWEFGLTTAIEWRRRLGLPREERWEAVAAQLAALPVADGVYVAAETATDTFSNAEGITDHPTMLAPLGLLPGKLVDPETMRRTLLTVMERWNWQKTWGWDYPMIAMTAARLGEGGLAVDALLKPTQTNTYLPNGHNYQRPPLPVYLPGNGGLLTAVAMMAAGWEGGPGHHAPGFPQDGTWNVCFEGLHRML